MSHSLLYKQVYLSEGGDSSKSSESSECNSSEEAAANAEPSQDPLQTAFTETVIPNAIEDTAPGPSPATINTSALLDPEDPQTSTDTSPLQLIPDDPAQTDIGIDVSNDIPDPAQNSNHADTVHVLQVNEVSPHPGITEPDIFMGFGGTTQPQLATTYHGFPQGATPPFPPHIKPTLPPFSTTPSLPIPIGATMNGVPLCFTFQFGTREPDPPRGDSI